MNVDTSMDRENHYVDTRHVKIDQASSSTGRSDRDAQISLGGSTVPRKTMMRIDWRILPTITVIYIMAFLDRINFGNALVYGLRRDLGLHGQQANICISLFFVAYVIFEIPATMAMKWFKPHVFLSACMFLFGILTLAQGFVHGFSGLAAARFFMGMTEAAIYPGCFYLMSMWYRREQAQKRFSFFFSGASFAGAFGGLLATAIGKLDGKAGYAAWRWIFILEGTLTCVLALVSWFTISDFPEDAKWLSDEERSMVMRSLINDQGESGIEKKLGVRSIAHILTDLNMIFGAVLYFCIAFSAYGLAFFIPSIIADFGYSPIKTQLYSVAPWSCTLALSLLVAYFSDLSRRRYHYIMGCLGLGLIGNLMLFNIRGNIHASYAGVFLYLMGVVTAAPLTICWYAMNLRGHQERAVGIPWQVGFGNTAGIVSTFAFPPRDAPRYVLAYSLGIGFLCLGAAIATSYYIRCRVANQRLGHQRYML